MNIENRIYPNIYFWIIVLLFTLSSSGYTYELIKNKIGNWKMDVIGCAVIYSTFIILIFLASTR